MHVPSGSQEVSKSIIEGFTVFTNEGEFVAHSNKQ